MPVAVAHQPTVQRIAVAKQILAPETDEFHGEAFAYQFLTNLILTNLGVARKNDSLFRVLAQWSS